MPPTEAPVTQMEDTCSRGPRSQLQLFILSTKHASDTTARKNGKGKKCIASSEQMPVDISNRQSTFLMALVQCGKWWAGNGQVGKNQIPDTSKLDRVICNQVVQTGGGN